jgi:hypothetical protein
LIAVAVSQIDRYPVACYGLVDPALEIAITHIEKIIPRQHAAYRNSVTYKNSEDLAADVLIGGSVRHGSPMFERRSSPPLSQRVLGVRWLRYFFESYPLLHG